MSTLYITDEVRTVVARMRLAQIHDADIAKAIGVNQELLVKVFGERGTETST